jgi:hypothetical protein
MCADYLVLHSRAVRKVLVSFSLAMCSEISNHTTLLIWVPTGLWQLPQVPLKEEALSLPLLLQALPVSLPLLAQLIFTFCLLSFHESLLHSPLVFILPRSSSLPLLNAPSFSLLGRSVELLVVELVCEEGDVVLYVLELRRGVVLVTPLGLLSLAPLVCVLSPRAWKKLQFAISITFLSKDSSSLASHNTSRDCFAFKY